MDIVDLFSGGDGDDDGELGRIVPGGTRASYRIRQATQTRGATQRRIQASPRGAARHRKQLKQSVAEGARPGSSSAAYRHLCSNAGVGGSAGVALLKQILGIVKLQNTRELATSEHHLINNTRAFRAAVLKRLAKRKRGQRSR